MFSKLLKEHREAATMTKAELAEVLRITYPYISQLETGKKPPTFRQCEQMSKRFKLTRGEELTFFLHAFLERLSNDDRDFIDYFEKYLKGFKLKPQGYSWPH